jgi:prepilin peptidase CpaA
MTTPGLAVFLATIIFPAAMAYAALMDLTTMKIRNGLMLALLVAYPLLAPLAGLSLQEIGSSTAIAFFILIAAFTFFALGWIGGGDAKLATVTVLWLGANHALAYVTYAALLGGALTICLLQFRNVVLPAAWQVRPWVARLHATDTGVPYGIALALAGLLVFPDTPWMAGLY